jgi:hypothetical protein
VGLPLGQVNEHVALANLVGLAVLPGDPGAAEDEEELLLGSFGMRRSRPHAGIDLDPLQPDVDAPGRAAEVVPATGDVSDLAAVGLDVVPVSDVLHEGRLAGRG